MTTNFFAATITEKSVSKNNLKKSKLSKRTLELESLESREMLSVNPLGIDNYYISPDFVQTAATSQNFAQDFTTEASATGTSVVTYTGGNSVTVSATGVKTDSANYSLFYKVGDDTLPESNQTWTTAGWVYSGRVETSTDNAIAARTHNPSAFGQGTTVYFTWVLTENKDDATKSTTDFTSIVSQTYANATGAARIIDDGGSLKVGAVGTKNESNYTLVYKVVDDGAPTPSIPNGNTSWGSSGWTVSDVTKDTENHNIAATNPGSFSNFATKKTVYITWVLTTDLQEDVIGDYTGIASQSHGTNKTDIIYTGDTSLSVGATATKSESANYSLFYKIGNSTIPTGNNTWTATGWTDSGITADSSVEGEGKNITPVDIFPVGFESGTTVYVTWVLTAKKDATNGDAITDYTCIAGQSFAEPRVPVATATTNSTSVASGVTSGAVTITWTKPTKAVAALGGALVDVTVPAYKTTDYKITISDGNNSKVYYSLGKTTLAITDLVPDTRYSYKVENKLTPKDSSNKLDSVDQDGYVVVTSGLFKTEAATLADKMAVGRPTDVKTTPTENNVKITWKAPVNYTGGYKVSIVNADNLTKTFEPVTIAAGAKTELVVNFDTNETTDKLKKGGRYKVVITPTSGNDAGANGLASTTTNFVAQKTQSDPTPTVTAEKPETPAATLFTITPGTGKIVVTKASGQNVPDNVDGYYIVVAQTGDIATKDIDVATYVTKAQFEASGGVTIGNLPVDDDYDVKIFAANSAGESAELVLDGVGNAHYEVTSVVQEITSAPASAKNVTATKDTTVANKVKVTWESNDAVIGAAATGEDDYAAKSYDVYYSTKNSDQWVFAGNALASATKLELTVENLLYAKDYDFAVVANCDKAPTAAKVAALAEATNSVKTGDAPTVEAKNILTAKKVLNVKYAANAVTFDLEKFVPAKGKTEPDQYYVVLRDANKAVIAQGFVPVTTTNGASLSLDTVLTPKAKYTVEVYGVSGTTVGTTKASGSLSVADYPAATLKVTASTKPTVNGVSITVTDKTYVSTKFYYVQYTKVADAKSKPDWSTATVEKLTISNTDATHVLGTKLDPNTQYYVRIVTADADVKIVDSSWEVGSELAKDNWKEATTVVFGKELKVKTTAVPLATVGKPGFSFNGTTYNMTLRTVGQTMLSAKGAGDIFDTGKPLNGADFSYKLLVSLDSKVDKVTGKLLGSAEIALTKSTDITIETYKTKNDTVTDGQYTLEYALTGSDGILGALGITASNAASLKNLNFQLVTTVTYDTNVSFDSVTKPGKVAMPKWFV